MKPGASEKRIWRVSGGQELENALSCPTFLPAASAQAQYVRRNVCSQSVGEERGKQKVKGLLDIHNRSLL